MYMSPFDELEQTTLSSPRTYIIVKNTLMAVFFRELDYCFPPIERCKLHKRDACGGVYPEAKVDPCKKTNRAICPVGRGRNDRIEL